MMKRYIVYGLAIFELFLISSCTQENPIIDAHCSYSFITRAEGFYDYGNADPLTYRIITFDGTKYAYDNTQSGTYIGVPGEIMIPKKLDKDGNIVEGTSESEDAASVLDNVSGNRYIVCYSPGKEQNSNGSIGFHPAYPETGRLLCSYTKCSDLGKFKTVTLENMKDLRSQIVFKFSIDPLSKDEIKEIDIKDFVISGIGSEQEMVNIYPAQRQIIVPTELRKVDDYMDVYSEEGKRTSFSNENNPVYIASAIYAPRDIAISILKLSSANSTYILNSDYLQATFMISQNGHNYVKTSCVLNKSIPELKPMYKYEFNFNIKSSTIDLKLDVYSYEDKNAYDWNKLELTNQNIDEIPKLSMDLGTWPIDDWQNINLESPEI